MDIKNINCQNCGSSNIKFVDENSIICNDCSTKMMLNYSIYKNNNESSQNTKNILYEVKKTKTSSEFLRETLINLSSNDTIPYEVFENMSMFPIELSYSNYAKINVNTRINYSASIGYNKRIEHKKNGLIEYEYKTDWKPFSGHDESDVCYIHKFYGATNINHDKFDNWIDSQQINNYKETALKPTPKVPSTELIESCAKDSIYELKNKIYWSLPGDKKQDFKYNSNQTYSSESYLIPEYIQKYKYKEKEHYVSSFATKNSFLYYDFLPSNKSFFSKKIFDSQPYLIPLLILGIISFCFLFIANLFPLFDSFLSFGIPLYIPLLIGLTLSLIYITLYFILSKKTKMLINNINESNRIKKIKLLESLFLHYNLPILTIEEKEMMVFNKSNTKSSFLSALQIILYLNFIVFCFGIIVLFTL